MLARRVTTTALTRWATIWRVARSGVACDGAHGMQPAASHPASTTKLYVTARVIADY